MSSPSAARQNSAFLESLIRFLMPFFIGTAVDIDAARLEILETLESYATRTSAEMLNAAQIIAFGMSTLDTLAEAKAADLSPSMRIRFRGCANGLNRSTIQQEKALDRRLAREAATTPAPQPVKAPTVNTRPAEAQALNTQPATPEPANKPLADSTAELLGHPPATIETQHGQGAAAHSIDTLSTAGMPTTTQEERNKKLWADALLDTLKQLGVSNEAAPGG